MNNARRKEIEKARGMIQEAKAILEQARDEESDFYDNMPESLQSGEKGERAQAAIDALTEACDDLENVAEGSIAAAIE